MKIAVTCENDQVFAHFGHTREFAIFETDGRTILSENRLSAGDAGHCALSSLLAGAKVDLLICGGIGPGAINALTAAGIELIGGASGNVREVVQALLNGTLEVRQDFHCNHHHHEEGHSCGSGHSCGGGHTCGGGHSCGNH